MPHVLTYAGIPTYIHIYTCLHLIYTYIHTPTHAHTLACMHIKTQHTYILIHAYKPIHTLIHSTHHINLLIKAHTHIIKSNTYTHKNKHT